MLRMIELEVTLAAMLLPMVEDHHAFGPGYLESFASIGGELAEPHP